LEPEKQRRNIKGGGGTDDNDSIEGSFCKAHMPSRQFDNMFDSFRRDVPVRNESGFNVLNSVPPLHILHCRE
jgi:hypothetical protein